MRGNFDNSAEWLGHMPPSSFSTKRHAEEFAEGLDKKTKIPWVVELVPLDEPMGGGFKVQPPEDRLRDGLMTKSDWSHLQRLFEAAPYSSRWWYLFPDEIGTAFTILGVRPSSRFDSSP